MTQEIVIMVLRLDPEMAKRLKERKESAEQTVIDSLEMHLFSPEERATRDVAHLQFGKVA